MPPAVACGGARRSRGQNKTKSARAVTRAQQSSHQHAARVVVAPPTPTCPPRPPSNAAAVVRLRARAQRRAQTTTVAADRRTPPPLPPRVCVTGRWAGFRNGVGRQAGGRRAAAGAAADQIHGRQEGAPLGCRGGVGAPVPARARGRRVGAGWRDSPVGGQGAPVYAPRPTTKGRAGRTPPRLKGFWGGDAAGPQRCHGAGRA